MEWPSTPIMRITKVKIATTTKTEPTSDCTHSYRSRPFAVCFSCSCIKLFLSDHKANYALLE